MHPRNEQSHQLMPHLVMMKAYNVLQSLRPMLLYLDCASLWQAIIV